MAKNNCVVRMEFSGRRGKLIFSNSSVDPHKVALKKRSLSICQEEGDPILQLNGRKYVKRLNSVSKRLMKMKVLVVC